ncbi:MAG: hypothetical protein WDZ52_01530 [Pseudohongiellaceae bacterium]
METFAESIVGGSLNSLIQGTYWLWPVLEISHFIGLSLLLGGLLVIDLRMAGHFRAFDPAAAHKLLPFVLLGFGINLVTGILFFYGDPMRYAINIGFQIKMGLVVVAGLNAALYYFRVSPMMHGWDETTVSPPIAKVVAYTSLAVWAAVLLCGRLIPYVGTG